MLSPIIKSKLHPLRVGFYRSLRKLGIPPKREKQTLLNLKKFNSKGAHTFFGYYDLTPFSADETKLLALYAPLIHRSPKSEDEVKIGYYDLTQETSHFHEIGSSTTWCWQQGCRLQWYPKKPNRLVLYNCLVNEQYGAVIRDITSKKIVQTLHSPLYSVTSDGRWGLSLNFSRLQRLRPGYGYNNFPDETDGKAAPEDDGVWLVNLETGQKNLLFSIAEITRLEPLESMKSAVHYFNHLSWNPSGSRFLFFHVWMAEKKRYTRLITCDRDGKNKYALINEGLVSHYTWKSDAKILAYSFHQDTGTKYHLYSDQNCHREVVGNEYLTNDGHPSYSPDKRLILTDTYPDKYRDQHLLLYNLQNNKLTPLGQFFSPLKYQGELRCDLHPRWSPSGKHICFDSAHEKTRAVYVLSLH